MTRALAALLVVAAILAAALWYVTSSDTPAPGAVAEQAPLASAQERTAASDLASGHAAAAPSAEATTERTSARVAAPTVRDEQLSRAQWVEGRVVFPPRTPPDEELFVTAEGVPFEHGEDHRVKVGRDGSFRVAFSEGTTLGALWLDGRYLYLPEKPIWEHGRTEPFLLEPVLGGRIAARVVVSDGVEGGSVDGDLVRLHLRTNGGATQEVASRELGPELEVAFDALIAECRYEVAYDGTELVGVVDATVTAGETRAVVIELARGVRLAGRVVDERGEPLDGVWVQAHTQRGGYSSSIGAVRGARTSPDGAFAIDALFAGAITLQASLAARVTGVLELGALDDGERRSDLSVVLERGGSIGGIVTWPDGTPAEASLELVPYSNASQFWGHMLPVRGKSDAQGRFRITGLVAAEHLVRAQAKTTDVDGRELETERRWTAEIERVETGAEDVALVLSAGHALAGRVVDDRGVPLDDFRVSARRGTATTTAVFINRGAELSGSYRDTGGAFALEGFTPGEWLVDAAADGHARSERRRVTVPDARRIELTAPREARVSGVVLGVDGEPRADVEIEVERQEQDSLRDDEAPERSDAEGAFELVGLAPGRVRLIARSPSGTTSAPLELELVPARTITDVVLQLRAGATVTGEVVDRDGRPEVGLQVNVHLRDGAYRTPHITDAAGRFEARGLAPGPAQVYTINGDGLQISEVVMLTEGGSAHVVLAPPKTATVRLHGRITAGGEPLGRARLGANRWGPPSPDGNVSSSAAADAEGRYEVALPGPGTYGIRVNAMVPQWFDWSTVVVVPPVAEHALDVAIPLGRISGRVTRTSGEPLRGIRVSGQGARDEELPGHGGESSHGSMETDADGRYELRVPTGTYTVRAGGDRRGVDAELEVVAGVVEDLTLDVGAHLQGIDFALASGGVLVGDVTASDGIDVSQAEIWLDTEQLYVSTCEQGSFRLGAVTPGSHRVRATSRNGAATRGWTTVEIAEGATARVALQLEPATMAIAHVRDAAGAAVPCLVEAFDAEQRPVTVAGSGTPGQVYVRWLTRGRYTLRATLGGKIAERTVQVAGDEPPIEVELRFE